MTKKRFIYTFKNGTMVIIDKNDNILIRDKYRACDYLNKLNNEYEQLQDECYNIRENAKEYLKFVKVLKKENEQLEKSKMEIANDLEKIIDENEQLKAKNQKNIQFVFDTIETYSDDCFHHNEGGWSYMLNDLIEYLKNGMGLKND